MPATSATNGTTPLSAILYIVLTQLRAHYEYSPFGKVTVSNGVYADDNPYRFSSEVFDGETGLVYYNYRYYSPELGRWLSRDPIDEDGGNNLYGMVKNNPCSYNDTLGLHWGPFGQKLSYTTIIGPITGDCGQLKKWVVQWKLRYRAYSGGFVIQRIDWDIFVEDCNGNEIPNNEAYYWEAWEIRKNKKITTYAEGEGGDIYDDTYAHTGFGDCTKGVLIMYGFARYYDGLKLPASFIPNNPDTYAYSLPSTTEDPFLPTGHATSTIGHSIVLLTRHKNT